MEVQGGTVEIDAKPAELRFYDKLKGAYVYGIHQHQSIFIRPFDPHMLQIA